mgnify:CR=1 FL=1
MSSGDGAEPKVPGSISTAETRGLITTYLSYLLHSQAADGNFANFMNYDRTLQAETRSDDCLGRALWALGTTVQRMLGHITTLVPKTPMWLRFSGKTWTSFAWT